MTADTALASMTGYGSASAESGRYRVTVRMRSVNHRNLNLAVKIPESYRHAEQALRGLLKERLTRGHVDLTAELECLLSPTTSVALDRGVVEQILELENDELTAGLAPLSVGDLLKVSGVLAVRQEAATDWMPEDQQLLESTVEVALAGLVDSRHEEGRSIRAALEAGLERLAEAADGLRNAREAALAELSSGLRARLDKLLEIPGLDEQRLAQEAAVLAERSDVTEELERLVAHVATARSQVERVRPLGKSLEFLLQEIHRELNTLGAKCRHLAMASLVLDAKGTCEQIREQVHNVE